MKDKYSLTRIFALLTCGILILADQLTKYIIYANFHLYETKPVIDGVFHFTYIQNPGAVGGLFADSPWVFNSITTIVIIVCLFMFFTGRIKSKLAIWAVALVVSGGIGNMIDRLTLGYVIDFIDIRIINFYIFNVADCCVTIGAGMLILYFISDMVKEFRKDKSESANK